MRGITKSFAGVRVLRDVDIEVAVGEVHALVGQNGAGKSTIARILAGGYADYQGSIKIDGDPVDMRSPRAALNDGVAVIYQELSLVDQMTVAENILLGVEPGRVRFRGRALRARAGHLLEAVGMADDLPLDAVVGTLSAALRQRTEIAKALTKNAKVVVLDEPTARLPIPDRERLGALIQRIARSGTALILISHLLEEVLQVASRVTILRDGAVVESGPTARFDLLTLSSALLGRQLVREEHTPRGGRHFTGEPLLRVTAVTGGHQVRDVSFALHRGEIVGLAGLVGSGRTTLLRMLVGATSMKSGSVQLQGRIVRFRGPGEALRAGVALVPEDRRAQALFRGLSATDNLTLMVLAGRGTRFGFVGRGLRRKVRDTIENFEVRPADEDRKGGTFSGGNQQKLVLARAVLASPRILLVDQPTAGVDVGTKAQIHTILRDLAEAGHGVIVISDDLDELIALSDRMIVMRAGRVVGEQQQGAVQREALIELMALGRGAA
jgi:ABC-type sugar transport system ATPase subunit